MKRILGLLFCATLLWCAMASGIGAIGADEDIFNVVLYVDQGIDARGFSFKMILWNSSIGDSAPDNDDSAVRQMLKGEKDGDLRILDTMPGLSVGKVKFIRRSGDGYPTNALVTICIADSERYFVIAGAESNDLYEYPEKGKRTLLSDLLNTKTTLKAAKKLERIVDEYGFTEEACNLIKAELEKEYTPSWVLPTAIGGGVIVLAGAATAVVFGIRRKKRKAAANDLKP